MTQTKLSLRQLPTVIQTAFAPQNANKIMAGPTSGADAVPVFRALVAEDIPNTKQNISLTAKVAAIGATNITGTNTIGLYRVSYSLLDTTADIAAGTITVNFVGTDEAGTVTMSSVALPLTALGRTQGTLVLRISNTSSISYSTTLVGLIGTSQYALFISSEKML